MESLEQACARRKTRLARAQRADRLQMPTPNRNLEHFDLTTGESSSRDLEETVHELRCARRLRKFQQAADVLQAKFSDDSPD